MSLKSATIPKTYKKNAIDKKAFGIRDFFADLKIPFIIIVVIVIFLIILFSAVRFL
jgi:hypothetical protein